MKVILLKSVPKVGNKGSVVDVSQGYAENKLFPNKLAIPATEKSLTLLDRSNKNAETEKEIRVNLLDRAIMSIDGDISINLPANEQGNLFSKFTEKDLVEFLEKNHRIIIDEKCIAVDSGPIKKIGQYKIEIKDGKYRKDLLIKINPK